MRIGIPKNPMAPRCVTGLPPTLSVPMRAFLLTAALLVALPSQAQVGFGGLVGDPTGLTVKFGVGRGAIAVDLDLTNTVYGQLHYLLREQRVSGSSADVRFMVGPGIRIGEPEEGRSDEVPIALSALLGLNWYADRQFEIFGQLTPRLFVTPDVEGGVGAAFGLRFYP